MCWIKENESFNMSTISGLLMLFSCGRNTVERVGSKRRPCGYFWGKNVQVHVNYHVFYFLSYVYLGLVEGIFNTADLEFKREAIIPLSPKCLTHVFFSLLSLSHSLYNSPGFLVYETGVFLFIILSMLAGHTQILMVLPHLGQCSSSQKALESHLSFKKKRFKAVWDGMTSMFVKSALAEYLIPWTRGNKKLIVPRTTLPLRCAGQNMTT